MLMEKLIEAIRIFMIVEQIIIAVLIVAGLIAGVVAYFWETSDEVKFPKNETAERVHQEYVVKHYEREARNRKIK